MKSNKMFSLLLLFAIVLSASITAENKEGNERNKKLSKPNGTPVRAYLNINNISTVFKNDGISDIDVAEANWGFFFPKGSGKGAVFESGLLWGLKLDGKEQVQVGGSAYSSGLQPGKIITPGVAEDPALPKNRIYRVRPDVFPGAPDIDLGMEANDEGKSESMVREQYETDWSEWPADDGAPYKDIDANGSYDPNVDIPGVVGADQTIWFVANDLDEGNTRNLYGTDPVGMEMQFTAWAYAQQGALGNMFFRKYKIINKSEDDFHDVYVSMWSDVDLGTSANDFAGCDTTLSLGFCYNATANDPVYSPLPPPAVGFDFFQGPIVDGNANDMAIFNGKFVPGKKNLPMTSYYYFARNRTDIADPTTANPQGATQFYNFFQGKIGLTGEYFVDYNTGLPTTFALAGDPLTRTGWVDGQQVPGGDRRIGMASGPFEMAIGDTQEVVVAEICAGAIPGMDRLSALGLLKFYDKQAQLAYDNFFDLPVPPPAPEAKTVALDRKIILDWGYNPVLANEIEKSNSKGYKFQGYNIYQLPSASASFSEAKRIATFDIADGLGKIEDFFFDASTGVVARGVQQFGNDTGIKRYMDISTDEIKGGTPLINGIRYYFAVTSYSYNEDPDAVPNNLENPLSILTVVPNSKNPGEITSEVYDEMYVMYDGTADASVTVKVIDPFATTGHEYEIFFDQQHYYLDRDGEYKTTSYPDSIGKVLGKDVSPAYLSGVSFIASSTECDLIFTVQDLELSPDYSYSDGVKLVFPSSINIISAENSGNDGDIEPTIDRGENSVTWGSPDTTQDGPFHGGELLSVKVRTHVLPLDVQYTIWDDGWGMLSGPDYGITGEYKHAEGVVSVSEEANYFHTENHWNVRDLNTSEVVSDDHNVYGGVNVFTGEDLGIDADPIVDGLQISFAGSFDAPFDFAALLLNGSDDVGDYNIDSYGANDWSTFGPTNSARAIHAAGDGNNELIVLQKDIELRFTGEYEDEPEIIINGTDTLAVWKIKEGTGSVATIYHARGMNTISEHPMNPNPGSTDAFTVRIPFEVWNVDDDRQINLVMVDRLQDPTAFGGEENVTRIDFYGFNPTGRMYCFIHDTEYSENVIPIVMDFDAGEFIPSDVTKDLTWNIVFWETPWVKGDVLNFRYNNPLLVGVDKFKFSSVAPRFSKTDAKKDVKKINVFPNPYYAVNSEELNKYNRFVTFTHLPDQAKIRIFDLAGTHVRTIEKDSDSQFERWDLSNQSGLPVASGMYIAYIDMPEIGETKILKLGIIQEQQILDRY
ncbi:MAG: T9SS type A sorting domain-containing protein [Melioribacteraceae bacterium]|nr:T9SS type A sorting domain-containing protein [Melioribacteraceae bacterium]